MVERLGLVGVWVGVVCAVLAGGALGQSCFLDPGGVDLGTSAIGSDAGYLYAGDPVANSVRVLDPESYEVVGEVVIGARPRAIEVSDGYGYVALDDDQIGVLDLGDPVAPALVGIVDVVVPRLPRRMARVGDLLVIAGRGVGVYDISDPEVPVHVGSFGLSEPYRFVGVELIGDALYFGFDRHIWVADVSDPSSVVLRQKIDVGGFDTFAPSTVISMCEMGGYLAVALEDGLDGASMWLLDTSEPFAPTIAGVTTLDERIVTMGADGDRAVVYANGGTARILDIANPAAPVTLAEFDPSAEGLVGGDGYGVLFVGDRAFVRYTPTGVVTLSMSGCQGWCSRADQGAPSGELDFFDLSAFLAAYAGGERRADLAEPFGEFDFFDVSAYLSLYSEGCP